MFKNIRSKYIKQINYIFMKIFILSLALLAFAACNKTPKTVQDTDTVIETVDSNVDSTDDSVNDTIPIDGRQ